MLKPSYVIPALPPSAVDFEAPAILLDDKRLKKFIRLDKLSDTLLLKLISGELHITDTERFIGATV